jgi:hypothetical protein
MGSAIVSPVDSARCWCFVGQVDSCLVTTCQLGNQLLKKNIYIVIAIPWRASATLCKQGNKQPKVLRNVLVKGRTCRLIQVKQNSLFLSLSLSFLPPRAYFKGSLSC